MKSLISQNWITSWNIQMDWSEMVESVPMYQQNTGILASHQDLLQRKQRIWGVEANGDQKSIASEMESLRFSILSRPDFSKNSIRIFPDYFFLSNEPLLNLLLKWFGWIIIYHSILGQALLQLLTSILRPEEFFFSKSESIRIIQIKRYPF